MKIIIPRIPHATTQKELRGFVEGLLETKHQLPFTKRPDFSHCDILINTDPQGIEEHHALFVVHPETAGEWLIQHLTKQRLHNKPIYGRQYFDRARNDARKIPGEDRRRLGLHQDRLNGVHIDIHGYDQCTQEHRG
ncbi:MAG: hypothetical protein RPU64_14040 [Candidatus Sedimenticola sp. (ex Thyasira tokunagai)]